MHCIVASGAAGLSAGANAVLAVAGGAVGWLTKRIFTGSKKEKKDCDSEEEEEEKGEGL